MKKHWLHKNNNKKLIVFFSGWGMDYTIFQEIESLEYDVLMYYQYQTLLLDNELESIALKYKQVDLITWSMGTWVAGVQLQNCNVKFQKKTAINGTLKPIDDDFGILTNVYQSTINFFGPVGRVKFFKRMWNNMQVPDKFRKHKSIRTLDDQKEELIYLQTNIANLPMPEITFDKACIGDEDIITPTKNQVNFWLNKTEIVELNAPHFPFYLWNNWDSIANL
ncbi:MAG: DUF452 family protein [Ichthyobacteriaceae bacterium]|nr:DUF452 family protein [Ichthyobacteriaceae bacterium]